MDIGMLWFDNDQKTSIPNKVERAAQYYQKKYGVNPDICYVHPKMVNGEDETKNSSKMAARKDQYKIGKILVLINEMVLPDHFWIGIKTAEDRIS
jgi:hypothetical protein